MTIISRLAGQIVKIKFTNKIMGKLFKKNMATKLYYYQIKILIHIIMNYKIP